ncbi:MspA family porin [Nocardia sp. NPDC003693]
MNVFRIGRWSIAAAAATVLGFLTPGTAAADVTVALPDGHIERPGVRITSVGERAIISPSLAANGAGRTAWVTGTVSAEVETPDGVIGPNNGAQNQPGTNGSSTHGASGLTVGYIVGCQVALGALGANEAVTLGAQPMVTAGLNFPLSAGQVAFVAIDNIDMPKSGTYHIQYQDAPMEVQGCAGYAQARQFSVVEIVGAHYKKISLYGQPFSLG